MVALTPEELPHRNFERTQPRRILLISVTIALVVSVSCRGNVRRSGIPAGAQTALDTAIEDIDAGRYEKLYDEASDEWHAQSSLDQTTATFERLQERLGKARTRSFETAREEQTATAPVPGHSVTMIYQTTFDRGQGMETFTLIEHGGRWTLAKYYVSSSELK